MIRITIHYKDLATPAHRLSIDWRGVPSDVIGGSIGPVGKLIGFSQTATSGDDPHAAMSLDEYLYGDVAPDQVDGWYPRFSGDVAPFVYWVPIKSIDIL